QAEHYRRGDQPEDHPPGAERPAGQVVLVPVGLSGVHDLLGDYGVLDLADGRTPRVPDPLADREVFEVTGRPGQRGDLAPVHAELRRAMRLVRRKSSTRSPRWSCAWVCHVTTPEPGWLADSRVAVTVDRAVSVSPA